ncbi:MAG: hypothetical protein ACI8QZ_001490 [Chlamydiales bacterium]|jgi:hypothetical protein
MIRSVATITLAALLCGSAAAQQTSATIQVLRGRVVIEGGAKPQTLMRNQEFTSDKPLQLEVGAGSEVEIRWSGVASMHVWGPSSLDWTPDSDGSVGWSFTDLAWADLEVRRGEHRLDLPGDWRTLVSASAIHLRGLPSGPVELRHHAGPALMLEWRGNPDRVRPPLAVYAGSSLRLESVGESNGNANSRSTQYKKPGKTAAVTRELTPPPATSVQVGTQGSTHPSPGDRARQPEFVERSGIVVTRTPQSTARTESARPSTTPGGAAEPATRQVSKPVQAPAPVQAARTDDPWRGVLASEMNKAGPLSIERALGTEVRVTTSGSWKVLVDAMAPGPVWCFGPEQDVRIHPGGIVKFGAQGGVQLKFGKVEVVPAPSWRKALDLE